MDMYLLLVTCLAIVIVVLGVSWWKWHAFISLTVASLFLAIMSGLSMDKIVGAYETGVGSVLGHLVGILALGTILGKMMSDSGAGMQVAEFFIRFFGIKKLPWAMLFAGFIIGIPVFFEVGIVILLPLVISIHKTTRQNILLIALPVIAGLSIVHGLVPPHPGAMTAIGIYNADLGRVLLYSLVIALPAAIVAGPVFAKWVHKRVIPEGEPELIRVSTSSEKLPNTGISFFIILLPVLLMVLSVMAPYIPLSSFLTKFFVFIGSPVIALLISCFAAFYLLGMRQGMKKGVIKKLVEESLLPVGSIILIIGAGGGFKQILIDSGVGTSIAQMSEQLSLSPIVLAFMVAGLIRIATGSATVALTTAAGIVSPIIVHMSGVNLELLVIATGAGSLMFSHVNDAGFWLVKEYLGLTVKETFKTWTVLETLLSFIAFGGVLLFDVFI
ncbi:2-keto-3-deoxygluconate permease [Priestia megaterium]|jgi:gluconate:H+ symporter, GntP family|uniref:Transporter, gluconate:H+ symporter family protein n=1 Tax=Priestia megaterium (strain ATCC 14581 / DSM 32 / CCUG 1817 / JCM 2506 / NBRC 15308 / NCIMB 9376 / NCTC 10342 / NRRL B-14308 / VKM B-512 / Ford 19) TaxID=1348623 RepID=A0A0B6A6B3_PRIM2|nr:gluconate:H+ symporter [Priestia megaterium]AJI20445.1 transporter, gluconate:H+ symporter family protein [Priestia megaterium NBRC 15308 = ATCC 14581]KFM97238.1 transporter, gluconate:H+ symporter family protein [Priestia megaterium]KGJ85236.1 2-keto-3-deoxygluconate permease [Priestia megaterium NBRC 15308 = ATCC 14581]MBU8752701.1 GntP family permease [Priestia megaterium]MDH3187971.1 gluconate:H+ symporter [Priestia megaterium]